MRILSLKKIARLLALATVSGVFFTAPLVSAQLVDPLGHPFYDPESGCVGISSSAASGSSRVYLLGDSWLARMKGVSPSIEETLMSRGMSVLGANSVVGRSINGRGQGDGNNQPQSGLEAIGQDRKDIQSADKIVVILGTNPDDYSGSIANFVNSFGNSNAQIYWVNTSANSSRSIARSASQANEAIRNYAATNSNFHVVDWFSVAFPGGNATSISTTASSSLMDSDRLHPSLGEGTSTLIDLIASSLGGGTGSVRQTSPSSSPASRGSLPQLAVDRMAPYEERVAVNRPVYEALAAKHQLSWQIFATLHIREAGADPNRSMLGGEPLGTKAVDSDNTPHTLEESGDKAAGFFKDLARGVYDIEITSNSSDEDLRHAFLAYNRGYRYKRVPASEGGPWPPEKSPYVMNLFSTEFMGPDGDGMLFPGGGNTDGRGWGEPSQRPGDKNSVPGAMTILAYLGMSLPGSGGSCGNVSATGDLVWPVVANGAPAGRVTACWSDLRTKTVSGGKYYHSGIDIGAAEGTDVLAVKAGRVVFAGQNTAYGNLVVIEHADDGIWSHYGHLVNIEPGITADTTVTSGQKIGGVGNTGISLGAHLHLNMYRSWPFGALPEGAGNSNGQETINPLTNGLVIPDSIQDIPNCKAYPNGGREDSLAL